MSLVSSKSVLAVILAGGKGTRLASRLNGQPKPLIKVSGIPLLRRQLLHCQTAGIGKALILVNYKANLIEEYLSNNNDLKIEAKCLDDGVPKGTAGSVLSALNEIPDNTDNVLIVYGDTLFNVDLFRFYETHVKNDCDATIFLHPNDHPYDSDLVEIGLDNRIKNFNPSPRPNTCDYPNLVNAALYYIKKSALINIVNNPELISFMDKTSVLDFGKHLFPLMLHEGQLFYGYLSAEYIKDIGTPERLDEAEYDIATGRFISGSIATLRSAIFIDRDGVLNIEKGYIVKPDDLQLYPNVGEALKKINHSSYLSILITNQPVVARGDCSNQDLIAIFNRLEMLLGYDSSYLDKIYYCPHHPDKGFVGEVPELKVLCNCRKPLPGMILQAKSDFNIMLEKSWFIGDRTSDFLCAANAHVTSVAVRTGTGGLDSKYTIYPDFIVSDFSEAVDFILKLYPHMLESVLDLLESILPGDRVLISGLCKSGKSTLASLLYRELLIKKYDVIKIKFDSYKIEFESIASDFYSDQYDLHSLNELYEALIKSKNEDSDILVPFYELQTEENNTPRINYAIKSDTIVILEGLAPFNLLPIDLLAKIIIVEAPDQVRFSRMWQGFVNKINISSFNQFFEQYEFHSNNCIKSIKQSAPNYYQWESIF